MLAAEFEFDNGLLMKLESFCNFIVKSLPIQIRTFKGDFIFIIKVDILKLFKT